MISPIEIVVRLAVATVLGCLVGMERERLDRAAGLRTHALVAVGAALCMLVSAFGFADILHTPQVTLDPSRIAAQVVSGVGFLGAGTIIMQREIVRGLTTAASVWAVAGIGLAAGSGLYLAAATATVFALMILVVLKRIEYRLFQSRRRRLLTLLVEQGEDWLSATDAAVTAAGLELERLVISPGVEPGMDRLEIVLVRTGKDGVAALLDRLRQIPGVRQIKS